MSDNRNDYDSLEPREDENYSGEWVEYSHAQNNEPAPLEELPPGYVYISGDELDEELNDSERDYRPIRTRRDGRFGCLGGMMYAVFIISVSIILACVAWIAANDVLALNKTALETTLELPKDIFTDKEVDVKDESGEVIGTEMVPAADIDYVADLLKDNGLIEYKFLFKLYARVSNADIKLDPGTYTLSTDFDYRALITNMQAGSEAQVVTTVTFPEGFTMEKIFKRLDANGICSYEDLMAAAADYDFDYYFLEDVALGAASRLEGYLFPSTYDFYQGMSATRVISKMLTAFNDTITQEYLDAIESSGYTLYDVVKIAAMIEKEAAVVGDEDDRNSVASVIYNRLRADWYLGIDATILYSYPDHEGSPTSEMLLSSDPYNTYTNKGLTPTPICSPGKAAIAAAINPASTNYYYYALDTSTGLHRFFTNSTDHANFTATQNYD